MKFKGLDIQHVEVIDDRLLLTCDGATIDADQNLGGCLSDYRPFQRNTHLLLCSQ